MSSHPPESSKKKPKILKRKRESEGEVEYLPQQPDARIVYPNNLENSNYYSIESFEEAISDQITTQAYHRAILENTHLFAGRIVMHLTQGINCLYSIFALKAGASHVYCVIDCSLEKEAQNVAMAQEIVAENNMDITVLSYRHFNAEVDIIICEPMGYCMYFDGLFDRAIEARDMYLVKGGLMFPNNISLKCCLIHDQYFFDKKVEFWNDVYSVPMKSIKRWISQEPIVRVVDPTLLVSDVVKFSNHDLQKVEYDQVVNIKKQIQLTALGDCKSNGVTAWFECKFTHGEDKVQIKASPWMQSTKYTQVTLYGQELLDYKKGQKVNILMEGQKFPLEGYSKMQLTIDGRVQKYSFS